MRRRLLRVVRRRWERVARYVVFRSVESGSAPANVSEAAVFPYLSASAGCGIFDRPASSTSCIELRSLSLCSDFCFALSKLDTRSARLLGSLASAIDELFGCCACCAVCACDRGDASVDRPASFAAEEGVDERSRLRFCVSVLLAGTVLGASFAGDAERGSTEGDAAVCRLAAVVCAYRQSVRVVPGLQ